MKTLMMFIVALVFLVQTTGILALAADGCCPKDVCKCAGGTGCCVNGVCKCPDQACCTGGVCKCGQTACAGCKTK